MVNTDKKNGLDKTRTNINIPSLSIWVIISTVLCFLIYISVAFGHHYFYIANLDDKNHSAKMYMILYVGIFMISMGLIYFLFILDKVQLKNNEDNYFEAKTILNISLPGIILSILGAILIFFGNAY
ncbi:hypothetical protein ACFSQJ_14420 [Croceitalea marina]|uniref:DUF4234 domain-containing protein n=1 Tax=Croceitalea marina TaxID=1775166 RepID=A0ABW5N066_9FLAO